MKYGRFLQKTYTKKLTFRYFKKCVQKRNGKNPSFINYSFNDFSFTSLMVNMIKER